MSWTTKQQATRCASQASPFSDVCYTCGVLKQQAVFEDLWSNHASAGGNERFHNPSEAGFQADYARRYAITLASQASCGAAISKSRCLQILLISLGGLVSESIGEVLCADLECCREPNVKTFSRDCHHREAGCRGIQR